MSKYDDQARDDLDRSKQALSTVRNVDASKVWALRSIAASLIEANRLARLSEVGSVVRWAQAQAMAATDDGDVEEAAKYVGLMKQSRDLIKELGE